jgi:predicted SAM-dependent methyltransferase
MNDKPSKSGAPIPWWVKIIAKIVLSRLPFTYSTWQRVGLFKHGTMDRVSYAQGVFNRHVGSAGLSCKLKNKTILELGPGDSVATALIAACYGARTVLIDSGDYADQNVSLYQSIANRLKEQGLDALDLSEAQSREDILAMCGAKYFTKGLSSLQTIADGSVDLIFSQAVLEHVRRDEFVETMKECHRILRADGSASHCVDLKDHLGGGLNNLRFRESIWESDFFFRSGFYTNRIRFSEMIAIFEQVGFHIEVVNADRWDRSPITKKSLSSDFASVADDDLLVRGFDVLMHPL